MASVGSSQKQPHPRRRVRNGFAPCCRGPYPCLTFPHDLPVHFSAWTPWCKPATKHTIASLELLNPGGEGCFGEACQLARIDAARGLSVTRLSLHQVGIIGMLL